MTIDRAKYAVDATWILQDNWCFNACLTSPAQVRPRVALSLSQFFDHLDEFKTLMADAPIQDKAADQGDDDEDDDTGASAGSGLVRAPAAPSPDTSTAFSTPPAKTSTRSPSSAGSSGNPKTMTDKQLLACIAKLKSTT